MTVYGHLQNGSVAVSPGQQVGCGQIVGFIVAFWFVVAFFCEFDARDRRDIPPDRICTLKFENRLPTLMRWIHSKASAMEIETRCGRSNRRGRRSSQVRCILRACFFFPCFRADVQCGSRSSRECLVLPDDSAQFSNRPGHELFGCGAVARRSTQTVDDGENHGSVV